MLRACEFHVSYSCFLFLQTCFVHVNFIYSLLLFLQCSVHVSSMCPVLFCCSPGRVTTPVSRTPGHAPRVEDVREFSSEEVLGRACRAVLEQAQLQASSLQAQPVAEQVRRTLDCSRCMYMYQYPYSIYYI